MDKKYREWRVLRFHFLLKFLTESEFAGSENFASTTCLFDRCMKISKQLVNTYCTHMVVTLGICAGLLPYKDTFIRINITFHKEMSFFSLCIEQLLE